MKVKYPLLLVFLALFVLFAGSELLKRQGIIISTEVFGALLLLILAAYAYFWQKKWKEDREMELKKIRK